MIQVHSQYKGLYKTIRLYLNGWQRVIDICFSPLFHFSLAATVITMFGSVGVNWLEVVKSSFPTILGFSLSSYALIFSLMGGNLNSALSEKIVRGKNQTYLRFINGTFFHAIFVQIFTYIYALLSESSWLWEIFQSYYVLGIDASALAKLLNCATAPIGTLSMFYSCFLMISLLFAVYRLANVATGSSSSEQSNAESSNDGSV